MHASGGDDQWDESTAVMDWHLGGNVRTELVPLRRCNSFRCPVTGAAGCLLLLDTLAVCRGQWALADASNECVLHVFNSCSYLRLH